MVREPRDAAYSPRTNRILKASHLLGGVEPGPATAYALEIDSPTAVRTLNALMGLATLTAKEQDVERAVEVLALVQRAAGIDRRTETQAEQLLAEQKARLSPAHFAAAHARGRALALDATVAAIRADPVM